MSYFGNCCSKLFLLFPYCYCLRKQTYILTSCISVLFFVSPQQLLNTLAHFNHMLQRKVELLGIVSCSNLKIGEEMFFVHQSCMLALDRKLSFTASTHRYSSLFLMDSLQVFKVWPLISANKDKKSPIKIYVTSTFLTKLRMLLEINWLDFVFRLLFVWGFFWGLGVVFSFLW